MTISATAHLATESYCKQISDKTGTFHVNEVTSTTVMLDEDSIRNTVSMYRATVAPAARNTPSENTRTQTDETDIDREEMDAEDMQLEERLSLILRKSVP